jgi:hypothetical protein
MTMAKSASLATLPLLDGKPFCKTHQRYAPEGRTTCVLCESDDVNRVAAMVMVNIPSYRGPDRRRFDLVECVVCERRLRRKEFGTIDAKTGSGLCSDCEAIRFDQQAAENRAQRATIARSPAPVASAQESTPARAVIRTERAAAATAAPSKLAVERVSKSFRTREEGNKTILVGADEVRWTTSDDVVPQSAISGLVQRSVDDFFRKHPVKPLGPVPGGISAADYIEGVRTAIANDPSLRDAEYVLLRLPERDAASASTPWNHPILGWLDQFISKHPRARIAKVPAGTDAGSFIKDLITKGELAEGDEWTAFCRYAGVPPEFVVFKEPAA